MINKYIAIGQNCQNCGAPLKELKCNYCTTNHVIKPIYKGNFNIMLLEQNNIYLKDPTKAILFTIN